MLKTSWVRLHALGECGTNLAALSRARQANLKAVLLSVLLWCLLHLWESTRGNATRHWKIPAARRAMIMVSKEDASSQSLQTQCRSCWRLSLPQAWSTLKTSGNPSACTPRPFGTPLLLAAGHLALAWARRLCQIQSHTSPWGWNDQQQRCAADTHWHTASKGQARAQR